MNSVTLPLHERRAVPVDALVLSLGALAVPVVAVLFFREEAAHYELLLWLLALLPAFLLAYHRGWRGAATGLAGGMAAFALTQAVLAARGAQLQNMERSTELVLGLAIVAGGAGWLAERLRRDSERIRQLAHVDDLTGLPNRRWLQLFLHSNFAAARRGRGVVVVLFDVDRFKQYNDTLGHGAGDQALRAVAGVLAEITREMDLTGRWGGEEFLSILTDNTEAGAMVFAERVRERIAALPLPRPVTISAGLAAYNPSMETSEDLVAAADSALYAAKDGGRNRCHVAGPAAHRALRSTAPPEPQARAR